jgi:hypothetical protein
MGLVPNLEFRSELTLWAKKRFDEQIVLASALLFYTSSDHRLTSRTGVA